MNKFTLAFALGTGLTLSLAAPSAQADPMIQTLTPDYRVGQYVQQSFPAHQQRPGRCRSRSSSPTRVAHGQTAGVDQLRRCSRDRRRRRPLRLRLPGRGQSPTRSIARPVRPCTSTAPRSSSTARRSAPTSRVLGQRRHRFRRDRRSDRRPDPAGQRHRSGLAVVPGQWLGSRHDRRRCGPIRQPRPPNVPPARPPATTSATFVVISNQPFSQSFVNVTSATPQTGDLDGGLCPRRHRLSVARARAVDDPGLGRNGRCRGPRSPRPQEPYPGRLSCTRHRRPPAGPSQGLDRDSRVSDPNIPSALTPLALRGGVVAAGGFRYNRSFASTSDPSAPPRNESRLR